MPVKLYIDHAFVQQSKLPDFNNRCVAALAKMNLTPLASPITYLFGSATFELQGKSYKGKLRAFVNFMLDNPHYDESLVPFYSFTPKGIVTFDEKAISHFLLYMVTPHGKPVLDVMTVAGAHRNAPDQVRHHII
jgi:hypothetical protein